MPITPSPAAVRVGQILRYLASCSPRAMSVSDISRKVEVPRATCDALLQGLAQHGFVHRDGELRYELGPACIALGDAARVANPVLRAANVAAESLARSRSAVVAVNVLDGTEIRLSSVYDFGPPFGLRLRTGESIPLVPPFGVPFVAWAGDEAVETWLAQAQPGLTKKEAARYRAALADVRDRGFAMSVAMAPGRRLVAALEELAGQPGAEGARRSRDDAMSGAAHSEYLPTGLDPKASFRLMQVAAPVFSPDGSVATSILLLGPGHELLGSEVEDLGRAVVEAARSATTGLR